MFKLNADGAKCDCGWEFASEDLKEVRKKTEEHLMTCTKLTDPHDKNSQNILIASKGMEQRHPVFPHVFSERDGNAAHVSGLTRRELFAAMAMKSISSAFAYPFNCGMIAAESVRMADALIEELGKAKK